MKITDRACKYAEVREKAHKLADGHGLDPFIAEIVERFSVFSFLPSVQESNPNIKLGPMYLPEGCDRVITRTQSSLKRLGTSLVTNEIDMHSLRRIKYFIAYIEEHITLPRVRPRKELKNYICIR